MSPRIGDVVMATPRINSSESEGAPHRGVIVGIEMVGGWKPVAEYYSILWERGVFSADPDGVEVVGSLWSLLDDLQELREVVEGLADAVEWRTPVGDPMVLDLVTSAHRLQRRP